MRSSERIAFVAIAVCLTLAVLGLLIPFAFNKKPEPFQEERCGPDQLSVTLNYDNMAVASDVKECSELGKQILISRNGSVVDAAIATALCVSVYLPTSLGIGGGFSMVVYEKSHSAGKKDVWTLDAREAAPQAVTSDMFVGVPEILGPKSIGVPGELKGYYEAWKRFGRLPWNELISPAVSLCRDGFAINKYIAYQAKNKQEYLAQYPYLSEMLLHADGTTYEEGDIRTDLKLAETLQRIADDPDSFYSGDLAEDIINDLQELGGIMTLDDLRNYDVKVQSPVSFKLKNNTLTLHAAKPPAGGVLVGYILSIIDELNKGNGGSPYTDLTVEDYQKFAEAMKFASALKTRLGDNAFVDVSQLLTNVTSHSFIKDIASQISLSETFDISYYKPAGSSQSQVGTSHLSILGPDGAAVSITSSINWHYGSLVRGNRTGIIFNNQLMDFTLPVARNGYKPVAANLMLPRKRPQSSMSPVIIMNADNEVVMVIGAAGGASIPMAVAFVASNILYYDKSVSTAMAMERMFHGLIPNQLMVEQCFPPHVADSLRSKGHDVYYNSSYVSSVNLVYVDCPLSNGMHCVEASCDLRLKEGEPAGI